MQSLCVEIIIALSVLHDDGTLSRLPRPVDVDFPAARLGFASLSLFGELASRSRSIRLE